MPGPTNPSAQNPQVQITALDSPIKTSTRMRYTGQSNGYKLSMNTVGERIVNAKAQEILKLIQSDHKLGHKVKHQYYLSIDWGNPLQARLTILHSGKPDEVITVDLSEKAFLKGSGSAGIAAAKTAAEKVAEAIAAGRAAIENHAEPVKSGRVKIQQVDRQGAVHGSKSLRSENVLAVRKGSDFSLATLSPVIRAEVQKLLEEQKRKFMIELNTLMLFQGSKKEHLRARITALEAEGIEAAEKEYNAAKREHESAKAKKIEADQKVAKLQQRLGLVKIELAQIEAVLPNEVTRRDQLIRDYEGDYGSQNLPGSGHQAYRDAQATKRHKEMTAAKSKCAQLESEIIRLTATIRQLEGEINSKGQAAQDEVAAASKMDAAQLKLEALKAIKANCQTAEKEYKKKEAEKSAAEAEIAALEEELKLKEAEITRLESQLKAETANLRAGAGDQAIVTQLEGQLTALKTAFDVRRIEIKGNQGAATATGTATVATLLGKEDEIRARLVTIEQELKAKEAARDTARKALDEIEKPVAELKAALGKLEKVDEFALAWGLLYRDRPEKSFEALKAHKNSIIDPQRKWYNRVPLLGIAELDDKKLKAYNADCLALWSKDTWDRSDLYFTVETTMSRGAENEVPFVDVMQGLLKLLDSGDYPNNEKLRGVAKSAGIEDQGEIEELFKQVKKIFEEAYKFKHDIERLKTEDFEKEEFWAAFKAGRLADYIAAIRGPGQARVAPIAQPPTSPTVLP